MEVTGKHDKKGFNPRDTAIIPDRNLTWERKASGSASFKIPKRNPETSMVSSVPALPQSRSRSVSAYRDTDERIKRRRELDRERERQSRDN